MMGDDNQGPIVQEQSHLSVNTFLTKVFFRMFLGLLATAIVAGYTYYSGLLEDVAESGAFIFFIIAEFVVAIVFSLGFRKFSSGVVTALFFAYAMLTGVTFSAIFGIMAYIGKNTTKDLTSLGTILSVSLLTAIVVSIINLFVGNGMIDIILDWVIIAIFMGFTVYDMNKIVALRDSGYSDDEHLYVYGAMELYLDFINLFIRILSIFGKYRRD